VTEEVLTTKRRGAGKTGGGTMLDRIAKHLKGEEGQGLVEYALIIFLVSIATMITLGVLGVTIDGVFNQINTAL
jgi:Flp pilus assembly pilin Flp